MKLTQKRTFKSVVYYEDGGRMIPKHYDGGDLLKWAIRQGYTSNTVNGQRKWNIGDVNGYNYSDKYLQNLFDKQYESYLDDYLKQNNWSQAGNIFGLKYGVYKDANNKTVFNNSNDIFNSDAYRTYALSRINKIDKSNTPINVRTNGVINKPVSSSLNKNTQQNTSNNFSQFKWMTSKNGQQGIAGWNGNKWQILNHSQRQSNLQGIQDAGFEFVDGKWKQKSTPINNEQLSSSDRNSSQIGNSGKDWNAIATQNGFSDMNEVGEFQKWYNAYNGGNLALDSKFGDNSRIAWNGLSQAQKDSWNQYKTNGYKKLYNVGSTIVDFFPEQKIESPTINITPTGEKPNVADTMSPAQRQYIEQRKQQKAKHGGVLKQFKSENITIE